jgi:hypothetical protein
MSAARPWGVRVPTDLSRYADWTTWLAEQGAADAVHDRPVDVRRHGTPIVVHDPDGLVELRPDDEDELQAAIGEAVDQIRQRRATAE